MCLNYFSHIWRFTPTSRMCWPDRRCSRWTTAASTGWRTWRPWRTFTTAPSCTTCSCATSKDTSMWVPLTPPHMFLIAIHLKTPVQDIHQVTWHVRGFIQNHFLFAWDRKYVTISVCESEERWKLPGIVWKRISRARRELLTRYITAEINV